MFLAFFSGDHLALSSIKAEFDLWSTGFFFFSSEHTKNGVVVLVNFVEEDLFSHGVKKTGRPKNRQHEKGEDVVAKLVNRRENRSRSRDACELLIFPTYTQSPLIQFFQSLYIDSS